MRLFRAAGAKVSERDTNPVGNGTAFGATVNDTPVVFDFADNGAVCLPESVTQNYRAVFKLHYHPDLHGGLKNYHPMSPVSWHDWGMYERLAKTIRYTARGKIVYKQRAYGNATARRNAVMALLCKHFPSDMDTAITSQDIFLQGAGKCLLSVCVPGNNNNMLDRGQLQYMSLGTCTISPNLRSWLSWDSLPRAGTHYLSCSDDYSDLIDKIKWVRDNREHAIQIGEQSKQLFLQTCTPARQREWVEHCIMSA